MHLNQIQKILFIEYKENGYFDMWNLNNLSIQDSRIRDIAELGLITTEISEAIEIVRSNLNIKDINDFNFSNLSKECADILIRTLNFMSRKGLDAEKVILHKNKFNLKRGKLHGRIV